MDKTTLEICEKLLLSRVNHLDELQRTSFDEVACPKVTLQSLYYGDGTPTVDPLNFVSHDK